MAFPFASSREVPQPEQPAAIPLPPPITANETQGVKLPDNFTVPYDEGFVTVKAESTGDVEWLILTTAEKIKYKKDVPNKAIDIAIPPKDSVISVFCWAAINGKPTKAARCDITVKGPNGPAPNPNPGPTPTPTPIPVPKGSLILTVIEDPTARDPSYTLLTRWVDTEQKLIAAGHKPYLKSIKDPVIKNWLNNASDMNAKFKDAVAKAGIPMVIIQGSDGSIFAVLPCPKTEAELLTAISGGK